MTSSGCFIVITFIVFVVSAIIVFGGIYYMLHDIVIQL